MSIEILYQFFLDSTGVCTDTRKILPGEIFFALKGPNFNGNTKAAEALEKGASKAVVDEEAFALNDQYVLVEDALRSLQDLARHHRRQFKIPVIALTGSNGKTTTKELIAAVLQKQFKTHFTQGNLNNHIGVPLTLLSMPAGTEMAVVEMGANHPIEINQLCRIAEPNFGLITNIGKAHLEGFGDIKGVQKAKGELFEFVESFGGKAFVNVNDPLVVELAYYIQNAHTYGSQKFSKTHVELIAAAPFLKAKWFDKNKKTDTITILDVETQLIGAYNLDNVIAAIAIGTKFKVAPELIVKAISNYVPKNNRSQVIERDSNTYILDAYNANPSSVSAALENLAGMSVAKKVAIIGDMKEQGAHEKAEHQKVVDDCLSKKFDAVYLVGEIFAAFETEGLSCFKNAADLKAHLSKNVIENATVLIKGSRSVGLEILLD